MSGLKPVIIIMEICKARTLRLRVLNKHSITHIMYIKMENVISNNKTTTKPGMFLVCAVGLSKIMFGVFFSVLVCKGRAFQSLSTVIDIVTVKGSVQKYCVCNSNNSYPSFGSHHRFLQSVKCSLEFDIQI